MKAIILLLCLATISNLWAKENVGVVNKTSNNLKASAATCDPTQSTVFLDINNVRTMLQVGGDMWWDFDDARYIIPNVSAEDGVTEVSSIFAGALWIGGLDPGGALKIAAQTYRQTGNDFWGGPLGFDDNEEGTIDDNTCKEFDKHWKVNRTDIIEFRNFFDENTTSIGLESVPSSLKEWPANGNQFSSPAVPFGKALAPFVDIDGDGFYDPTKGDYPILDPANPDAIPDQMIFWVFNDRGNIHTETGADAIGLEVHSLAFAFATNDDVNNMTFYKFKILNKATSDLDSTYFGIWVDPDLGCYTNDYVGCVPELDLGICYNGTAVDNPCPTGYGVNPPMVGVDYFRGPKDENGDIQKMSSFLYYNNDGSVQGNPRNGSDFYNYLSGTWRDGAPFTCGGNGKGGNQNCKFMFPDDPSNSNGWSECTQGNPPADRRFLMSAGAFTLQAGAVNDVIIGVVWVRPQGNPCDVGFDLIKGASEKAQALFDNNFKLIDGPDAPTMVIREMDRELIITLVNTEVSNNHKQLYEEVEPTILNEVNIVGTDDSTFVFQGYKIFQVFDATVSASELGVDLDPLRARLIAQFDVKDEADKIINYIEEQGRGLVPYVMVEGANLGVSHSIRITEDKFATGDDKLLVNHRTYYFTAISYAYNNYYPYDPNKPSGDSTGFQGQFIIGQKLPYLEGRNNVKNYSAIPHIPIMQNGGLILNAEYGDAPLIQRMEGQGNGGLSLLFTEETEDALLKEVDNFVENPIYQEGMGPIDVMIIDPISIAPVTYQVRMDDIFVYEIDSINKGVYTPEAGDIIQTPDGSIKATVTRVVSSNSYIKLKPVSIISPTKKDSFFYRNVGIVAIDLITPVSAGYFKDGDTLLVNGADTIRADGDVQLNQGWTLWDKDNGEDVAYNDMLVEDNNDQIMIDIRGSGDDLTGFSIKVGGAFAPGTLDENGELLLGNGFIEAEVVDENPNLSWLEFWLEDEIIGNWIMSGTDSVDFNGPDDNEDFESILDGAWSPFMLARDSDGPGFHGEMRALIGGQVIYHLPDSMSMADLASVDLVFTSDKTKWTKCVVVEAYFDPLFTDGNRREKDLRAHGSWVDYDDINSDGNPIYSTADSGRSWFPGYAINLETGERLNIIFAESTAWEKSENGGDMLWNPTRVGRSSTFQLKASGKHFIYIMDSKYDKGSRYYDSLQMSLDLAISDPTRSNLAKTSVFMEAMWTCIPKLADNIIFGSLENGLIPTTTRVKLRVSKPYAALSINGNNNGRPVYEFSLTEFAVDSSNEDVASSALDLIKVVPNPYYAYSRYETFKLDNRVKFTNLPKQCVISIYSLDGALIRRYAKDDPNSTSLDWDIKNTKGVPIAGGMYIIHISADEIGEERVLKWFGVLRPTDLDSF
ncbi:MAG: hypothetical protein IH946_00665 [Bacteroidetes bacterium]|nr:hypothetical protein [Bacteroidota bacterium]